MVEAAPCELEPPVIDWVNVSQPAQPIGARYMPTQDVRFKGEDNVGVDISKFTLEDTIGQPVLGLIGAIH